MPASHSKKPEYDLVQILQNTPHIELVDQLLSMCVVENEQDCLLGAGELLSHVDNALTVIDRDADLVGPSVQRKCRVCALGTYVLYADREDTAAQSNFGLRSGTQFKIFICERCGHSQLFAFKPGQDRQVWKEKG